ncbi:unnamed protein product [Phytophthora fragariaefolia]|uniref:Unnamed protein product n=1 Tax=Phytophthora fragariaefolia TaxID=1490495 RepID=A0A9W6XZ63_9STRA|nr:unnamed protein product [Phytophthora fragariaefolia]
MEFQECFSLLATRPAHAHEHCEDEKHAEDKTEDASTSKRDDNSGAQEPVDLALLSTRELVHAFHRLQETRVQIYTEFRQCVAVKYWHPKLGK